MAFAPPDPKRLDHARKMERVLHEAAMREIADLEAIHVRRIAIQQEIRSCYGEYCPTQIAQAGKMMAQVNAPAVIQLERAENSGIMCWERIGRSNGGRKKGNLYRCTVRA